MQITIFDTQEKTIDLNVYEGLYNMTQLWKLSGENPNQQPKEWLQHLKTIEFVNYISEKEKVVHTHLLKTRRGRVVLLYQM